MSELKESWKNTGASLGHAFKDLGKSLVKSAKAGIEKADEWVNNEEKKPEEKKEEE